MISTPREAHTLCLAVQSSALSSARCRGASPLPHAGASENIGSISFTPPLVAFPLRLGRAFLRAHCGVLREGRFLYPSFTPPTGFPASPRGGIFPEHSGVSIWIFAQRQKGVSVWEPAPNRHRQSVRRSIRK